MFLFCISKGFVNESGISITTCNRLGHKTFLRHVKFLWKLLFFRKIFIKLEPFKVAALAGTGQLCKAYYS